MKEIETKYTKFITMYPDKRRDIVSGGEDGYSLEVFNVLGDTIAVISIAESAIESLTENEIFNVRALAVA